MAIEDMTFEMNEHGIAIERRGIRTEIVGSYEVPRFMFSRVERLSPVRHASVVGSIIWYSMLMGRTGRRKRTPMDVDAVVNNWHRALVRLTLAHDKDQADRAEADIEGCLTPILSAPIKQVREFYPKLLAKLKADPAVPFLVWRGYEIWVDQIASKAPDEEIKQLKADLARQVAELVEQDMKDQLPDALIRALQWRSEETLEKTRDAVTRAQARGERPRLRGRESCLFLEVGGTEDEPEVCVQI